MKKNIKKISLIIMIALLVVVTVAVLTACGGGRDVPREYQYFTVSFDSRGGSAVESVTTREDRVVASAEISVRAGHNFAGWFFDGALTKQAIFPLYLEANIVLYADWRSPSRIVFNSNGGTEVDDITGFTNYHITAPAVPTQNGYLFVGWYEDDITFTRPFEFYYRRQMLGRDITLYAKWVRANRITFLGAGVVTETGEAVSFLDVAVGHTIDEPIVAQVEGFRFDGWHIGNASIVFPFRPANDITITAIMTPLFNNITINFAGIGTGQLTPITGSGSEIILPDAETSLVETPQFRGFDIDGNPTIAYVFNGWYDEATGEVFRNRGADGYIRLPLPAVSQTVTLTALWIQSARFARIDFEVVISGTWPPPHPTPQARAIYIQRRSQATSLLDLVDDIIVEGTGGWFATNPEWFDVMFRDGNVSVSGYINNDMSLVLNIIRR